MTKKPKNYSVTILFRMDIEMGLNSKKLIITPELKTLEWWISGLMLDNLKINIILQNYLKSA